MGWRHMAYHIINSDPGHTCWKEQLDKTLKIAFASLSRKSEKKEKKEKKQLEWQLRNFLRFTQTQLFFIAFLSFCESFIGSHSDM